MNRIEWDWYGTWVIDWLMADAGDDYIIWKRAYLNKHPELEEARENSYWDDDREGEGTDMDLIMNHYHESLKPLYNSFPMFVHKLLHLQCQTISLLIWKIKWKIRLISNRIRQEAEKAELAEDEILNGYYFCPCCNRRTYHFLSANLISLDYELANAEAIVEGENNPIFVCESCQVREEKMYREEVYG